MTSPHLTDGKPPIDPVEGLRLLVGDLRALAARLELKEHSASLEETLKAAQERVCGPRATVMLLSEHADLKRRFLERLLGPNLTLVPNAAAMCTRLEYGPEPECMVTMPLGLAAVLPLDQLESFLNRAGSEGVVETPTPAVQSIRLPNPTLKNGLAVIDAPVVQDGEHAADVLECAAQADAWIFVLNADHVLSEASQALLRRLPERGTRLEMVVENAETLNGEERLAARDRLMRTLRENCNIEEPRLTLVASAATEGDEGNFWHGRFATFHSVMMLRGRARWMEATRTAVLDALSQVGAEIDFELRNIGLGLRHARLRLGMKDLEGLRARFQELGRPEGSLPPETKSAETTTTLLTEEPQGAEAASLHSRLDWSAGSSGDVKPEAADGLSSAAMLAEAMAAAMTPEGGDPEPARAGEDADAAVDATLFEAVKAGSAMAESSTSPEESAPNADLFESGKVTAAETDAKAGENTAELPPPAPGSDPVFVRFSGTRFNGPAAKARQKRGISVHFSDSLKQLLPPGKLTLLKRVAGVLLLIGFICLILWALSPRSFLFGSERPGAWDYHQPKPALASHAAPVEDGDVEPPQPGSDDALPDASETASPNISATPLAKPSPATRLPLAHPVPSGEVAGVPHARRRHHHHLLGLGKVWHWIRHPRGGNNANATTTE